MSAPRKCVVCKIEYRYCPKCGKDDPTQTWRMTFCSEDCREVYKICSDYKHKKMTKAQAKKKLNKYDVDNYENYSFSFANAIKEILL